MNFIAPNHKEHVKEYFNQKIFFKYFCIFINENRLLCLSNDVISISFEINSEKSLGKASSFTKIYGILKDFPDLTLYMETIFWAY